MKRVQIVFNINDPHQKELYDYLIEKSDDNVSNYGRLLVKRDMQGAWKDEQQKGAETIDVDINRFI